jgi:glutamate dehydrogenase
MHVRRDENGALIEILESGAEDPGAIAESVIHAEVTRISGEDSLEELRDDVEKVLGEVTAAVADWQPMRERCLAAAADLDERPPPIEADERTESQAFLRWLADGHFTFLGYREYELLTEPAGEVVLSAIPHTGRGLLRGTPRTPHTPLGPKAEALARSPHPLVLSRRTRARPCTGPPISITWGSRRTTPREW